MVVGRRGHASVMLIRVYRLCSPAERPRPRETHRRGLGERTVKACIEGYEPGSGMPMALRSARDRVMHVVVAWLDHLDR